MNRPNCDSAQGLCNHVFQYDWDEVGNLARARRWDSASGSTFDTGDYLGGPPAVDLRYAYSGTARVLKTATSGIEARYTVDVFPSLRLKSAKWDSSSGNYERTALTEHVYLAGIAHVSVFDKDVSADVSGRRHVALTLGDELGSTSVVVDKATGGVMEHVSYQAYGAADSDYRPDEWGNFREDFRFTGKEEDEEVGITYFGARYYHPLLGRWLSADSLTIHASAADLNPYAYVHGSPIQLVDPDGLDCLGMEDNCSPDGSGFSGPPVLVAGGGTSPSGSVSNSSGEQQSERDARQQQGIATWKSGLSNFHQSPDGVWQSPSSSRTFFSWARESHAIGIAFGIAQMGLSAFGLDDPAGTSVEFRQGQALGQIAVGVATMLAGATGEAGGLGLSASGGGAVVGVPIIVQSAAVVAVGLAAVSSGVASFQTAAEEVAAPAVEELVPSLRPDRAVGSTPHPFDGVPKSLHPEVFDIMSDLQASRAGDAAAGARLSARTPHVLTGDLKGWTSLDIAGRSKPLRFLFRDTADGVKWMVRNTH